MEVKPGGPLYDRFPARRPGKNGAARGTERRAGPPVTRAVPLASHARP